MSATTGRQHAVEPRPPAPIRLPYCFVCILHARLMPGVLFCLPQGVFVARPLTTRKLRWQLIVYAAAALVLMPLLVLLISWQSVDPLIWEHLMQTQMARLIGNTLVLVFGVGLGVVLLGVSLAWLTSLCEFPGRRWLDWALMLPFAVPAYVLAFVMVAMLDFAGPIQTVLRGWFGSDFRLPPIRSTGGVILTLVLVFYPYVYMLARSAFMAQGRGLMEASRILGQTP